MIDRLFSYPGRKKMRRNLETMRQLDAWLGYPHRDFASIHIAGTNGKGSVSTKIAAALSRAGFRTGLFLSPHLSTWRERISVDGALIPEEFAEAFLPRLFAFIDKRGLEPTFFELMTALCFAYFRDMRVEWAVLETGLGGRFDATNVVIPRLSVITSIGYDHMELLGSTLEEIAQEKAGIIKPGVPLVIGPKADFPCMKQACCLRQAPEIAGFYDAENSSIARTALRLLGVDEEAIEQGLLVRPPCRFEVMSPEPVIFDAAHNPDGFERLSEALGQFFPDTKFTFVLAMGKARDPLACVEHIRHRASRIICVSNGHERLMSGELLAALLDTECLPLEQALHIDGPMVVAGSFYIMDDARSIKMSAMPVG